MYAQTSGVGIDGNSTFTNNTAGDDGGAKGRQFGVSCNAVHITATYISTTLEESTVVAMFYLKKTKYETDGPFLPLDPNVTHVPTPVIKTTSGE